MGVSAPIVIFGAGNLGQRVARAVTPIAFCDNNPSLWGTAVEGIRVVSPEAAIRQFPNATFVVAIWHPSRTEAMIDRIAELHALGAQHVLPFTALLPEFGDALLPHLLWERPQYYATHSDEIARARELFDPAGREEFDRQLRLRLGDHGDQVIDLSVQYFPTDLFHLSDDEVFIDCGAYDGDTVAEFRKASKNQFSKLIAFEPDPLNFSSLKAAFDGDPSISLQPYATGKVRAMMRFSAAGTGSHIDSDGTCEVQVVPLDEVLCDVEPTYIKFDIEGSELDALEGGRETISRSRPKLAVCLYHVPNHLWTIPLLLQELLPGSRMTLRTYAADGFECVCYCIPD